MAPRSNIGLVRLEHLIKTNYDTKYRGSKLADMGQSGKTGPSTFPKPKRPMMSSIDKSGLRHCMALLDTIKMHGSSNVA
jgi:hypothetical protein